MILTDFTYGSLVLSIALGLVGGAGALASSERAEFSAPACAAFRYFAAGRASGFEAYLKTKRPAKVPPEARSRILAGLPKEGEVQPSEEDLPKLAAIERILEYHDRTGAVDIKVIRVFQASMGLHARSVVLISEHALRLLGAEELQALVAHELGHDYFWDEYALAREQALTSRIQELELRCDGVAVITVLGLGLHPEHLISAAAKINQFNARFGTPWNENFYVSAERRTRFIKAMADLVNREFALRRGPTRGTPQ